MFKFFKRNLTSQATTYREPEYLGEYWVYFGSKYAKVYASNPIKAKEKGQKIFPHAQPNNLYAIFKRTSNRENPNFNTDC